MGTWLHRDTPGTNWVQVGTTNNINRFEAEQFGVHGYTGIHQVQTGYKWIQLIILIDLVHISFGYMVTQGYTRYKLGTSGYN